MILLQYLQGTFAAAVFVRLHNGRLGFRDRKGIFAFIQDKALGGGKLLIVIPAAVRNTLKEKLTGVVRIAFTELRTVLTEEPVTGAGERRILTGCLLDDLQTADNRIVGHRYFDRLAVLRDAHRNTFGLEGVAGHGLSLFERVGTERQVIQKQCAVRPSRATCSDGPGLIQKLKLHAGQRIPGIRRGLADENASARSGIGEILRHRLIGLRELNGNRSAVEHIAVNGRCFDQLIAPKRHIVKGKIAVGVGIALFDGAAVCIDKLEMHAGQSCTAGGVGLCDSDAADSGSVYKGLAYSLSAGRNLNGDRGGIQNVAVRSCGLAQVVSPDRDPAESQLTVRSGISLFDKIPGCVCELEVGACQSGPGRGIGLEDGDAAGTVGVGDRLGDEITVLGQIDLYRRIVKLITCGSRGLLEEI